MLTKEDILQIAEIIATANGHPAPGSYSAMVGDVFDRLNAKPEAPLADTSVLPDKAIGDSLPGEGIPAAPLIGTPVLTDPTEWPVAKTDIAV